MLAAITIACLILFSVITVRIAAVMMRLTGLPEPIARFQCLSALTGTGFTTGESEMIVNYPVRRRILMVLMLIGHLGLASLASTFIVTFVEIGNNTSAVLLQILVFVATIFVVAAVLVYEPLDKFICKIAAWVLTKTTPWSNRRFDRTLQMDENHSIAEHFIPDDGFSLDVLSQHVTVLALKQGKIRCFTPHKAINSISKGDIIICFATEEAHNQLEDILHSEEAGS